MKINTLLHITKVFLAAVLFTTSSYAQDFSAARTPANEDLGSVVVEQQDDYSLSYKKRRSRHGALFSLGFEKFYPLDYRSLYNDSYTYIEDIIGEEPLDLVGAELGYKLNLALISMAFLGSYSSGGILGAVGASERSLKINRTGLSVNFALDALFEEPWVVPYAQVGAHQLSIRETNGATNDSKSATAAVAVNYRYGLLLQLDWLENAFDKSAQADRLRSSGLENTYVDFYIAEHLASAKAIDPGKITNIGDPNLRSSGELGLGLKMEF